MATAWQQRPGEPAKDYELFEEWLRIRPYCRTVSRLAKLTDMDPVEIQRIHDLHEWRSRAAAFDESEKIYSQESRSVSTEAIRDDIYTQAAGALHTVRQIMLGRLPKTAEKDRKTGRPLVKADSVLSAALATLDRCGVTVPKRYELTGLDGDALKIEVRERMESSLSPDEIKGMIEKFGGTSTKAPPRKALAAMGEGTDSEETPAETPEDE